MSPLRLDDRLSRMHRVNPFTPGKALWTGSRAEQGSWLQLIACGLLLSLFLYSDRLRKFLTCLQLPALARLFGPRRLPWFKSKSLNTGILCVTATGDNQRALCR